MTLCCLRLQRRINRAAQRHAGGSRLRVARAAAVDLRAAGRHGRAIYGPLRALGGPAQRPVGGESPAADRRWAAAPTQTNRHTNQRTALRPRRLPALLCLAAPALARQRPSGSARRHDKHARTRTDPRATIIHTRLCTRTHTNTHALSHSHLHTHPPHAHNHARACTHQARRCWRCRPPPCRAARAGCSRDARTHARTHAPWPTSWRSDHGALDASCACLTGAMHRMRMSPPHTGAANASTPSTLRRRTAFHAAYGRRTHCSTSALARASLTRCHGPQPAALRAARSILVRLPRRSATFRCCRLGIPLTAVETPTAPIVGRVPAAARSVFSAKTRS